MDTFEVVTVCPYCERRNDACSCVEGGHAPVDGDVTMCAYCGKWAVFDNSTSTGVRLPTLAEVKTLATDRLVLRASILWAMGIRPKG